MAGYQGIDNSPIAGSTSGISGVVNAFADLPAASAHNSQVYLVKQSTGTFLINRKSKGFYLSDGATWSILPEVEAYAALAGATFTGPISATNLSNTNTGDETNSTILSKIGFTPENVSNKSTTTTLGTSDTLYPTQNAVKTYADSLVFNPRTTVYMFEDFEKSVNYYNGSGWFSTSNNGGTMFVGVDTDWDGTLTLSTGTSTGGRSGTRLTSGLIISNGVITYEARAKIEALDSINNTIVALVGIGNYSAFALNSGLAFRYHPTSSVNQGNFYCVNSNTGTATTQDSGVTVVANTYYDFKIVTTNNTSAAYYINGNLVATISTNMPDATVQIGPMFYIAQTGTATVARFLTIDYVTYKKILTTPR